MAPVRHGEPRRGRPLLVALGPAHDEESTITADDWTAVAAVDGKVDPLAASRMRLHPRG